MNHCFITNNDSIDKLFESNIDLIKSIKELDKKIYEHIISGSLITIIYKKHQSSDIEFLVVDNKNNIVKSMIPSNEDNSLNINVKTLHNNPVLKIHTNIRREYYIISRCIQEYLKPSFKSIKNDLVPYILKKYTCHAIFI